MGISAAPGMTSEEIVALSRAHTLFSWSVQGQLDPIAIDHAEGVYLYTPEGQRILDFNSQLMSVNIGHGDRRVIDAITAQAHEAPVRPAGVRDRDPRPPRGEARRDPARRHEQGVLHARRRRGDRERDQARPPLHRPLQAPRPLPRLPRRDARGDDADRRLPPLGERARPRRRRPLPRHAPLGREGAAARSTSRSRASRTSSSTRARAPSPPCSSRRSWAPTASSSRPTATSQGVREICDRYGILMVADEVMAGFGRTGRWFAVDHWDVVPGPDDDGQGPDVELPAAGRRRHAPARSPRPSRRRCSIGGLTYIEPPGEPRGRARDDRRLRGGRPHRQRRAPRRGHARATTRRWRRSTRRVGRAPQPRPVRDHRPRPRHATRGRRSRRSTGRATR